MPINTLMSIQNAQNKFNKAIININTDNYLSVFINSTLNLQTTTSFVVPPTFTIECWVKITTLK